MTGWAESPGLIGEGQEMFRPTFRAANTALIFGWEPLEMMKQHPVEDGPLRPSRPSYEPSPL